MIGADRRAFVHTMGCQMNRHDSARAIEMLREAGYEETRDLAEADLVLLNTCTVREKAEHKARSALGALAAWKDGRAGRRIVLAGCVAQRLGHRWLDVVPAVDAVLGPDGLAGLPRVLAAFDAGAGPCVSVDFDDGAPEDFLVSRPGVIRPGPTAFVSVAKGCDERCTFCIVPSVRGGFRSRPVEAIVAEATALASAGVREITLLGQAVNAYRWGDADLGDLLRMVADRSGVARLRYTSPHPRFVGESLARAHAAVEALCEHVHLPVQSGSDRVLHRMGRRHGRDDYLRAVDLLRSARDGITFGTDVIVGFPGETEEDFRATLALLDEVAPTQTFAFAYSVRPGTPAERWTDDVRPEEKSRRLAELQALTERLGRRRLASMVGSVEEVLVEGPSDRGERSVQGRTRANDMVHVVAPPRSAQLAPGDLVRVRIDEALAHCLRGVVQATVPPDAASAGRAGASPR